jgi:hypothetical protein
MGVSTDAILAFGFDLGEEVSLTELFGATENEDGFDFDERIAELALILLNIRNITTRKKRL